MKQEGFTDISIDPPKNGPYITKCLSGSFNRETVISMGWFRDGRWSSMDWETILAWKERS